MQCRLFLLNDHRHGLLCLTILQWDEPEPGLSQVKKSLLQQEQNRKQHRRSHNQNTENCVCLETYAAKTLQPNSRRNSKENNTGQKSD